MNQLGAVERAKLRAIDAHIKATEPDPGAGRPLADMLRRDLPDLDDVTIGRVLMALGAHSGQVVEAFPDVRALRFLSNQIVMAAVDLTAIEWQESDHA